MATPSEAEIRTQWVNIVDVLETNRAFADETMFTAGGPVDVLEQSLEGDYIPPGVSAMLGQFRATHAGMVSPSFARFALEPVIREYARILSAETGTDGFGAGYRTLAPAFRALQDYFRAKSYTVESRAITYDTSPTAGGSNVGDGTVSRLTVDENADNLEFCHVERKLLRCRSDQNTGAFEQAEVFECLGSQSTPDGLQRAVTGGPNSSHLFGSGAAGSVFLTSKHAGGGRGGSLLVNSSFSTFSSGAPGTWSITYTGDGDANDLSQNTTTFYRGHPGASTDAALEIIASSGGTITLTQPLTSMRQRRIDPDVPYFLRLMYHRTGGSGTDADGTLKIRMGTNEKTVTLSAQSGWNELVVDFDENCWPRNFNEDPFAVDIEWDGATAGATLLIDDVIFCPWDLWDGTYWCIRGNDATHVPWLVDDILEVSDSGGLPATGKLQYWLWLAGLGYLPSTTGTPTITDPS